MKAMRKFTPNIARPGAVSACPSLPTGKLYYGLDWTDPDTIVCYSYSDSVRGAAVASVDWSMIEDTDFYTYFDGSSTFVFEATVAATGRRAIVTWTLGGSLQINELLESGVYLGEYNPLAWEVLGSTIYVVCNPPGGLYAPLTATVGATGSNGSGFTAVFGSSSPPEPDNYDVASLDILPSAALAIIGGAVHLDWWSGVDSDPTFYAWPAAETPTPEHVFTGDQIGTGTINLFALPPWGSGRIDPTGDRFLVFTSAAAYRVAGLPTAWVADLGELRVAPLSGDCLFFYDTYQYVRIPSAYFGPGVTVDESCGLPIITFDALPGGGSPDIFARN